MKLKLLSFLLILSSIGFAQVSGQNKAQVQNFNSPSSPLEVKETPSNSKQVNQSSDPDYGTYQFQVSGRYQPSIPANLHEILVRNRHTSQDTYVKLSDLVTLKILPYSVINRADFKPIDTITPNTSEQ